jgi:thiol-disulfide isomerase/thioredoxin/outer membrane lipoprotein-sorting protein
MLRRSAALLLLAVSLFPAAPARAEIPASESALLEQVQQSYRNLKKYWFVGSIHTEITKTGGAAQAQHADFQAAMAPGGKMRDEVQNPAVGGAFVSDGRQVWVYNAGLHQLVHKTHPDSAILSIGSKGIAGSLILRFGTVLSGATAAKRLADESVTFAGRPRPCDVIEITYPSTSNNPAVQEAPRMFWIDKTSHLVLRQRLKVIADIPQLGGHVEQTETIAFQRADVDPAVLPESLFTFRVPAGTKEVDQFEAPAQADPAAALSGKPAIDFALKDLAGRPHSLKALRGKVVLLDFWATWCGPCRMTMPRVAKIHRDYQTKGVEVLSINVGETAAQAGAYVKKNGYTFTTLLDGNREVAANYQVNGIPTLVVIDRTGKISSYLVGAHDESALREALAKAGVK